MTPEIYTEHAVLTCPTPQRCHHFLYLSLCVVGVPNEGIGHRQVIGGTGIPSETFFLGGV